MIFQTVNQFLDFMVVPNRRNQSFIIMKYPKKAQEREQLDISYTNNIYSEYIDNKFLHTQNPLEKQT